MPNTTWKMARNLDEIDQTRVFSGGACNILDAGGTLLRNRERDRINDWLTERGITFFDPQIHPDTHGEEYQYPKHSKMEIAARMAARVNLYEISPRTFGGISSLEIASDHFRWHEPSILYYSDGDPDGDHLPKYSRKGHPIFVPDGIEASETARQAHYREFIKNANNMRKYLMHFARQIETLTVTFGNHQRHSDVIISPERMHAADMFRAAVDALSGERVMVAFTGGRAARDDDGNPLFIAPEKPQPMQLSALLDEYIDEANALRRAVAELIHVTVFTRVVFTQRAAILALEEILQIEGLLDS